MRKLIYLLSFLLLVHAAQASDFKGKFILSFKTGHVYSLENHLVRPALFGSQIGYFIADWISVGLDMNYMEYNEDGPFRVPEYYGFPSEPGPKWRWYSSALSGKLLLDTTRFSPFFKIGIGLYIPQEIYHRYTNPDVLSSPATVKVYGKTCPGYSLGMGLQYRIWKGLGLQVEGTIDHIINRARQINSARSFTFANINGGLSIIF